MKNVCLRIGLDFEFEHKITQNSKEEEESDQHTQSRSALRFRVVSGKREHGLN